MAFSGSSLAVDIIGFLGGILISIGPMAQLYKVIRSGQTDDISLKWMTLYLIGMAGSLTYSVHYKNYPILIPAVVETIIILIIFIIKVKVKAVKTIETIETIETEARSLSTIV